MVNGGAPGRYPVEYGVKSLLLSAGLGTRLHPVTKHRPKCLVDILGEPLLGYWLRQLEGSPFTEHVVNAHHFADQVRAFVQPFPNVAFVEEPELYGTAGTLYRLRDRFHDGTFLLAHSDNLCLFDPADFLTAHQARPEGCVLTMMTFETDTPRSCGIVETDDRGVVIGYHEKVEDPPGNRANAAVFIVEPEVLELLNESSFDFCKEVPPQLVGRMATYPNRRYHRDVGTVPSYLQAQLDLWELTCVMGQV